MSDTERLPDDLEALVRELPREVTPPRDLWPPIERRLAPRRRRLPAWLPLAAAIALVVLGSTLARLRPRAPTPPPVAAAPATAVPPADQLLAAIERDPGSLSAETVAALRRNVALIDAAIAETERALAADPGNDDLQALVRLVHRQRLDLLRQATRLPRT
ncbi:MAG: hypothetical protein MUC69_03420 [Gemmatimonadales bacterium]|jgi:hypothetical protein|nr:hypothetical protein [Gemmatimonadales bacterium]